MHNKMHLMIDWGKSYTMQPQFKSECCSVLLVFVEVFLIEYCWVFRVTINHLHFYCCVILVLVAHRLAYIKSAAGFCSNGCIDTSVIVYKVA